MKEFTLAGNITSGKRALIDPASVVSVREVNHDTCMIFTNIITSGDTENSQAHVYYKVLASYDEVREWLDT